MSQARRRVRQALTHPLVGHSRRRSVLGLAYATLAVALVVVSDILLQLLPEQPVSHWTATTVDGIVGLAVLATALSIVCGLAYALWNGGPAVAAAIPTAPVVVGGLLSGQLLVDIDLAVAVAAGALAAAVATARTETAGRAGLPGLGVATALTAFAGVAAARFLQAGAPHVGWATVTAAVLAGAAAATVAALWLRVARDTQ